MKENQLRIYTVIALTCLLTFAVYLGFEYYFTAGMMGVPLDDTWIHFQFAKNFANGFPYQYNPGEPTAGTTSPLYVIVLGTAAMITDNLLVTSVLISALFQICTCIFVYRLSLLIFSNNVMSGVVQKYFMPSFIAFTITMLTVFAGRLVWAGMSGMETTMFTFFCVAAVFYHVKNLIANRFSVFPALLIALATVSRPEGYLLFLLYLTDVLINLFKDKTLKKNYLKLILAVIIFTAITAPYLLYSYSISGHFFPNTFRGQGGTFRFLPDFNFLRISLIYFFMGQLFDGIAVHCFNFFLHL